MNIVAEQEKKMSSREIADLTGKKHKNVLRDIKILINQGAINGLRFEPISYKDSLGRKKPMYLLDFKATMTLVTGYDAVRRSKVIDRWVDLETGKATPAFKIPQTLSDALQLAADQARKIELDAPKVEFAETIQASSKSIKIGDYVKVISKTEGFVIGRNNFFKWLRYERILDNRNMPMQRYVDCGWFEVRESTYENKNTNGPQVSFTTLITGKGQVAVLNRFKKSEFFKKFLNKKAAAVSNMEVTAHA